MNVVIYFNHYEGAWIRRLQDTGVEYITPSRTEIVDHIATMECVPPDWIDDSKLAWQ